MKQLSINDTEARDLIVSMREKNKSYGDIAKKLNTMGYRGRNDKKINAAAVNNFLSRSKNKPEKKFDSQDEIVVDLTELKGLSSFVNQKTNEAKTTIKIIEDILKFEVSDFRKIALIKIAVG